MKTLIEIMEEKNLFYFEGKKKNEAYTDKGKCHSFIENFYQQAFSKIQDAQLKLLEIGIQNGGSLLLWSEFFFNAIEILGIDISDKLIDPNIKQNKNVKYLIGDAYDSNISSNLGNFDIIIDDGPHTLQSQIDCIKLYTKILNSGGFLIIEDIPELGRIKYLEAELFKINQKNEGKFEFEIKDFRQTYNRHDDILFIIRKN